ncbi:MAG: FtsX-like permease family protein [Candidatus Marinimicrobia bacterium]|nr:FtsX-like permease family protein [Candidatus Neomarinimicrobiota bacterium]
MMLIPKLAQRNLIGAGVRTWLNVITTSLALFMIVFSSGIYDGMIAYTKRVTVATEYGGGQYWHPAYDPDDPFSIDDSHGPLPGPLQQIVRRGEAMPILVVQGALYPEGRVLPVMIKGIPPAQSIIELPTQVLLSQPDVALPVLIGKGMARLSKLEQGDRFVLRWRDVHGSYDARDAEVVGVMDVENFKVDIGQVWLPLELLRTMVDAPGHATFVVIGAGEALTAASGAWVPRDQDFLLQDIINAVKADQPYARTMYGLLLALAAMGIFNSQVLSIFRRRKEIGTLMSLGMHRGWVVGLFTMEGALHSLYALLLTIIWGAPVLYLLATRGIPIPYDGVDIGIVMGKRMWPVYTAGLLGGTVILVAFIVTLVSYLPSRRIAQMNPAEALRGRAA